MPARSTGGLTGSAGTVFVLPALTAVGSPCGWFVMFMSLLVVRSRMLFCCWDFASRRVHEVAARVTPWSSTDEHHRMALPMPRLAVRVTRGRWPLPASLRLGFGLNEGAADLLENLVQAVQMIGDPAGDVGLTGRPLLGGLHGHADREQSSDDVVVKLQVVRGLPALRGLEALPDDGETDGAGNRVTVGVGLDQVILCAAA